MRLPEGFRAAGVAAGVKPSGRPDVALWVADRPSAWAATTTRNRFVAACVTRTRALYATEAPIRAIVVNAGNANCATGDAGVRDDAELAERAAAAVGRRDGAPLAPNEVVTGSTGVIGVPMPMDAVRSGIDAAADALSPAGGEGFATAILTTDLATKVAERTLPGGARVVGVAKGSGMIHPNMATMLAYVATDADVPQATLRAAWPGIVDRSFNQLTVDGDTSTNDMAIVMANGARPADVEAFLEALEAIAVELTEAIAADGEGATTLLRVRVEGAASDDEARVAARGVASSSLVKAAVYGRDPNWGRILVAAGGTRVAMDAATARVTVQGHRVYDGGPAPFDAARVAADMNARVVDLELDLGAGAASGRAWGCDLTTQYVHINADYTT